MALILAALACAGCANLVAGRVGEVDGLPDELRLKPGQLEQFGFHRERRCLEPDVCLGMLRGPGHPDAVSMSYEAQLMSADHFIDVDLALELKRPGVEAFTGTAVLLHGYGVSNETMAFGGLYFRFLGFDVLIPDLLGHGESDGPVGLGVQDAGWLDRLLDEEQALQQPVLLVGYSMGGVAALHLAQRRDDVAAVILQAPMRRFDEALVNYTRWARPFGARWVPESSLRKGAVGGLARADVTLEQTDLASLLAQATVPVLMLASEDDRVSPHSRLVDLQSPQAGLIEVPERSHVGMAMIGPGEELHLRAWLSDIVGLRRIPLPLGNSAVTDTGSGSGSDSGTDTGPGKAP